MSLNTTMPYYRNTSREIKTVREIIQTEAIKSARIMSRDKVKVKQNTSFGDLNRSKRKSNNSFYDNRNIQQNENTNILQSYLANAFYEKKENQQRIQMQEIINKNKMDENKQKEIKYQMRIASLEKESSKLTEMVSKLKKENSSLKQSNNKDSLVLQLQGALNQSRIENQLLKKQVTHLQNTNSNFINSLPKKVDVQKSLTLNTTFTANTTINTNNTFIDVFKSKEYIPSYLLALSLVG